jgi:hypothetical protein
MYLKGTLRSCLLFGSGDPLLILGYTNENYADDADSRKHTSRYLITYVGGVVS